MVSVARSESFLFVKLRVGLSWCVKIGGTVEFGHQSLQRLVVSASLGSLFCNAHCRQHCVVTRTVTLSIDANCAAIQTCSLLVDLYDCHWF